MSKTTFVWLRTANDSEFDPDFTLLLNGKETQYHVQDATAYGGGYDANHFDGQTLTTFGNFKTFAAAKQCVMCEWMKATLAHLERGQNAR